MEKKKSERADLQNKRVLFTEIGCIVALALVYFAFDYSTTDVETAMLEESGMMAEIEDMIAITYDTPPPPPEMPKIPVLSDQIEIVEDDILVDDDLFINLEDNADLGVELVDYIEVGDEEVTDEEALPFIMVEVKPTFNGGDANEFSKWVNQRLVYPQICIENGVSGRVTLSFTIKADGIEFIGVESTLTGDIYDLSGRLVKKNATSIEGLQKGIYLINGKKVAVK